jgi:excisionase family DNA binding protein
MVIEHIHNLVESKSMLKTVEVARILNIHVNTVRRWSIQGILRTYRVSTRGDRRFKPEDVYNLLLKQSEPV